MPSCYIQCNISLRTFTYRNICLKISANVNFVLMKVLAFNLPFTVHFQTYCSCKAIIVADRILFAFSSIRRSRLISRMNNLSAFVNIHCS